MAAGDAKAIPVKNAALRITFPILDADGDLVTGAATLDSEVSIDGGTFADCTNEATEIATSSGMYFLDLTASEMNGDTIAVIVKTSTSGAKTTPIVMYTAARNVNDLAFPTTSGRSIDVTITGAVGVDWANVEGQTTAVTLSGTTVGTATALGANAVDASQFTQAAADKVWSSATRTLTAFSTALALSVWDVLESAIVTASSIGLKLKNNLDAAITTRATPAQVNTEVVDALATDTYAESAAVPAATSSLATKITWLGTLARNKITQTATTQTLRNDADLANIATAAVSDDGTTFTRAEWV